MNPTIEEVPLFTSNLAGLTTNRTVQKAMQCQINSRTTNHSFKFNVFAVEEIILLNCSVGRVSISKGVQRKH